MIRNGKSRLLAIFIVILVFNIFLVNSCSRNDDEHRGGRGRSKGKGKGGNHEMDEMWWYQQNVRGGRSGSCFDDTTLVLTKNETDLDQFARKVMVKDLKEGSLVATAYLAKDPNQYLNLNGREQRM